MLGSWDWAAQIAYVPGCWNCGGGGCMTTAEQLVGSRNWVAHGVVFQV
ncbi:MAG: hypothetical protein M3010_04540 [Candidatus Dormibacteraeota bacterium]|nr:hypothetical protein [Candidatus Dormibacteraeota bacterium]